MQSDPLSDVLTFLGARCLVSGGIAAGGRWGVRFRRPDAIKFGAITRGRGWLVVPGEHPVEVAAGDVFFLKGDRSIDLVSELGLEPVPAEQLSFDARTGIATIGSGADFMNLGGHVALDERRRDLMLDVLPPVIHIPRASTEAAGLHWLLAELVREGRGELPGTALSATHLSQLMFLRVIRAHLGTASETGWLRGLADDKIAEALRLMHSAPGRDWSVKLLAKAVGLSRSVFAARFKATMGIAPLAYLSAWRMRLAAQALEAGADSIAAIAESLGYSSESAFSHAFKRTTGSAPKRFQRAARM